MIPETIGPYRVVSWSEEWTADGGLILRLTVRTRGGAEREVSKEIGALVLAHYQGGATGLYAIVREQMIQQIAGTADAHGLTW